MEDNENRLSAAYTNAESERYQGVTLSQEQYELFNDQARENLAKMVCTRRGWKLVELAGIEQKKDGTVRVVFRKVDIKPAA